MTFSKKQHQQLIDEMKTHTAETIRSTVNGKIDDLKKTTLTKEDFAKYVEEDMKWKAAAEPAIKKVVDGGRLAKLLLGALLTGASIVTAYRIIRGTIHL